MKKILIGIALLVNILPIAENGDCLFTSRVKKKTTTPTTTYSVQQPAGYSGGFIPPTPQSPQISSPAIPSSQVTPNSLNPGLINGGMVKKYKGFTKSRQNAQEVFEEANFVCPNIKEQASAIKTSMRSVISAASKFNSTRHNFVEVVKNYVAPGSNKDESTDSLAIRCYTPVIRDSLDHINKLVDRFSNSGMDKKELAELCSALRGDLSNVTNQCQALVELVGRVRQSGIAEVSNALGKFLPAVLNLANAMRAVSFSFTVNPNPGAETTYGSGHEVYDAINNATKIFNTILQCLSSIQ